MIKHGDVVGFRDNGGFRDAVLRDVLGFFSEKSGTEIVNVNKTKKYTKLAVSDTINMNSDKIVHEIFDGDLRKTKGINPIDGNIIKPLYLFLDEEVLLYAKLRGLKFKVNRDKKKDEIVSFVDALEKKHPELRRAVVNSYLGLEGLE